MASKTAGFWHPIDISRILRVQRFPPKLPSGKLTWQRKTTIFNRRYIFKWWIFDCYVSLPECTCRKGPMPRCPSCVSFLVSLSANAVTAAPATPTDMSKALDVSFQNDTRRSYKIEANIQTVSSWWFQPIWKNISQIDVKLIQFSR